MKKYASSVVLYTNNNLFAEAVSIKAAEKAIQLKVLNKYSSEFDDVGEKIIVDLELLDEVASYKGIKCAVYTGEPVCEADEVYPLSILAVPGMLTVNAIVKSGSSVKGVRRSKKNLIAELRLLRERKAVYSNGCDMLDFKNEEYIVDGKLLSFSLTEEEYLLHYAFNEKVRYGLQTKQRLVGKYGKDIVERMLKCLREEM